MKTIKRMDIVSKARRERESAERLEKLSQEAKKAVKEWASGLEKAREEKTKRAVLTSVNDKPLGGKDLDHQGKLLGMKRKYFGFESDKAYRKRLLHFISNGFAKEAKKDGAIK